MNIHQLRCPSGWLVSQLVFLLLLLAAEVPAFAQGDSVEQHDGIRKPDLAAAESRFEEVLAFALRLPDDADPMHQMQGWSNVMMSAVILDRVRELTEQGNPSPTGDSMAVQEQVLARWQRARPDSGGPTLFRILPIEDQTAKRAATIALLDRFPDDSLVVSQALYALLYEGQVTRALAIAEGFLVRNPENRQAFRFLFQAAGANETQKIAVLRRWAEVRPTDPTLVALWMGSALPGRDPIATSQMAAAFLATSPTGNAGLEACFALLRSADAGIASTARACVARVATNPDEEEAVAERATQRLAELAARDGDWSAMIAALDTLDPESRLRTLVAAARRLETPARCPDQLELLLAAADVLGGLEQGHESIASALRSCADDPRALALFFDLLRRAPADRASSVASAWMTRINGGYSGPLPVQAAAILEERLPAAAVPKRLYRVLDQIYQLHGLEAQRIALLRRWSSTAPESFDGEGALALAAAEVLANRPDTATEMLEVQLTHRAESSVAERLWGIYLDTAGETRAARLAFDLIGTGEPGRVRIGHTLAARSSLLKGDREAAEAHYWQALAGPYPSKETALELLSLAVWGDETAAETGLQTHRQASLEAMARRICEETDLASRIGPSIPCVADLLTSVGSQEAATLLADTDLPEDLRALRGLAQSARAAGQLELAERALKRILDLDPVTESSWIDYGVLLEKAGRIDELLALFAASREQFPRPPTSLYRAVGRALTAANRPEEAIDVLLETRGAQPSTAGGDWSRSWIDHELTAAYAKLGLEIQTRRTKSIDHYFVPFAAGTQCDDAMQSVGDAARDGNGAAAAFLGRHRFYGLGDCIAADRAAARRWLESGAEADIATAAYDLAMLLYSEDDESAADTRADRLLEQAVALGDVLAVETAALFYATGIHVERDPARAQILLDEAARLGSDGIPRFAAAARRTSFFARLLKSAVRNLEALSARGDMDGTALLARLAFIGVIHDIDSERTVTLARRAAEAGVPMAMRILSRALERGTGVEQDKKASLEWQLRCADAGDAYCMMFQAHDLVEGDDLERNLARGLRWLQRAAATGNWWSIADLARIYAQGRRGLDPDFEKAAKWRRHLAARGDAESIGWLRFHGAEDE